MEKWSYKNNYSKFLTIKNIYSSLYSVNANLFCFQNEYYNIEFYDTKSYHPNGITRYTYKVNLIGVINNEMILYENASFVDTMLLVNIKFYEIVSIIKYDMNYYDNYKILYNNNLYYFNMSSKKIQITKRKFNLKERYFEGKKIITNETELDSLTKILTTDNGHLILCGINNIIFINMF